MKSILITLISALVIVLSKCQSPEPFEKKAISVEKKVDSLLSLMKIEEKIDMLSGNRIDEIKGVDRMGIPPMYPSDGPLGLRIYGKATAFPSGISMAASWDTELVGKVAAAIAREYKSYGKNVLLGPCVNIVRAPHGGRNFESFGEDPYLASTMAVSYTKSVQEQGVIACVKHFACNNQEYERRTINVKVGDRALREIYLPAFKASVQQANCWSVMGSYNRLNGHYACANKELLTDILKEEWGFPGFVMSDWTAVHSTGPTLNAGMDLEMPLGTYLGLKDVYTAYKNGEVEMSRIDDAVRRILRALISMGFYESPIPTEGELNTTKHQKLVREAAAKSIVLLKNGGDLLPLSDAGSIALIGAGAKLGRVSGGGSSRVRPFYSVSPLDAIKNRENSTLKVGYATGFTSEGDVFPIDPQLVSPCIDLWKEKGFYAEYFDNGDFSGTPIKRQIDPTIDFDWQFPSPASGRQREQFSIRWEGCLTPEETDEYIISVRTQQNMRVYINDSMLISTETQSDRATLAMEKGRSYALKVEYWGIGSEAILGFERKQDRLKEAVMLAQNSDVAIVFAGWNAAEEKEGRDRESISLPTEQVKLINEVSGVNENVIVVLHAGAQIIMDPWLDEVEGILMAWYPGQECGNAIADILFGEVNPSGKLPVTFIKKWEDHSAYENFPGENGEVHYNEGIFVGYRHTDKEDIDVRFPFGYGLSYTTFSIEGMELSSNTLRGDEKLDVKVTVRNTGGRAGAEIIQLYIHDEESSLARPINELKGFQKVELQPNQKTEVRFTVDKNSLSFYDENQQKWIYESGIFNILVGTSSRDLELSNQFEYLQ